MFQIETAGLVIRIDHRYEDVRNLCWDYITGEERKTDICISVSEEELQEEIDKAPECFFGKGYAESVVAYEKISNALPTFNAFVMHSSVVEVNEGAYAFAAESGTGKSTHTRYWKETLGDRVKVINGDKPIMRFVNAESLRRGDPSAALSSRRLLRMTSINDNSELKNEKDHCRYINPGIQSESDGDSVIASPDEVLMAYGTPWCGKENWNTNACAPLKALCLLERGEKNEIFPINALEHLGELMNHFHLPGNGQVDILKLMELIDRMLKIVPVYRLRCTNDVSAAEMAIKYFGL